jgi:hypothetical protein
LGRAAPIAERSRASLPSLMAAARGTGSFGDDLGVGGEGRRNPSGGGVGGALGWGERESEGMAEEGIKKEWGLRAAIYSRRVGTREDVGGSAGLVWSLDSASASRERGRARERERECLWAHL